MTTAEYAAVAEAAALAVTLRGRMAALVNGVRQGDCWATVVEDAVLGMQALVDTVPGRVL